MKDMTTSVVCDERVQLIPGVFSAVARDGQLHLLDGGRRESFGANSAWKDAVLRRLAAGEPCPEAELHTLAHDQEGRYERVGHDDVSAFIDALRDGGWLMTTVCHLGRPLYTLWPLRRLSSAPDAAAGVLMLSRFALIHRDGGRLVVESPLAWARMHVCDSAMLALLGALAQPVPLDAMPGPLPAAVTARALRDLHAAGLAVPVPDAEETEFGLRQWSLHELWFHRRTRMGDGRYLGIGYGRTQWAKGQFDPPPARRPDPFPGPAIDLYRPDIEALRRRDPPLTAVVEDRRSIREHDDDNPITAAQLGELLYRCARVWTSRWEQRQDPVEYVSGPRPSGGSVYELELYPVVRRAAGLDPGMYHYDPHDHQLRLVRAPDPQVTRLLRVAARSAAVKPLPQVLIVIAARFGRLMWTYEEMPYSLILKHVGVLYQSMYLVATSMGLAACGLGGGDALTFTEATGLDYAAESSVGEFMLGSRPAG